MLKSQIYNNYIKVLAAPERLLPTGAVNPEFAALAKQLNIGEELLDNTGSFVITGSDQRVLFGDITSSGNISASGIVIADTFQSTGGDIDGISFTDDLNITGNITASGNISASGIFTAEGLVVSDDANITTYNITTQYQ